PEEVLVRHLRESEGPERPRVGGILAPLEAERPAPDGVEVRDREELRLQHDREQRGPRPHDGERPAVDRERSEAGEEDRRLQWRLRQDWPEAGLERLLDLGELARGAQ